MKYKVLLTGKNLSVVDDFFTHLGENFECMTTSARYEDICNHLKYFEPDIFVCCLNGENTDDFNRLVSLKGKLEQKGIAFAVIGSEEDCNDFIQYTVNIADIVMTKPITAISIMKRITGYLDEQRRTREDAAREEEERKRMEEEIAARRKHILVVDDDPLMLKMIKEHLHEQYDVATAPSGRVALKFLEKKSTNLILLDYEMPDEDGPAVLAKLHANDATKNIPVVFLTGITQRDKIEKALALKPQGYLLKPIDRKKLFDIITKLTC